MRKIALGFLLALVCPTALAQVYKCVDERGRTHYTDKPQPGCKAGPTDSRAAPPAPAKAAAPARAKVAARKPAKTAPTPEERAQLASRCKTLREQQDWLLSPRGAAVEAHAARLGQVKQALRECP